MLYIVPTPIGNLGDITLRAINVLKQVEVILCEDTRVTRKLTRHLSIDTVLKSYHTHNEHRLIQSLVEDLKIKDMALVSDGGTPGISDPGFLLIRACYEASVSVDVLPGACAITTAVVRSGLPCNRFYFEGFLPHKKGRQTRLKYIAELDQTTIIYESPHRLIKCLQQLSAILESDRQVVVLKEISKKFEKRYSGVLPNLIEVFSQLASIKGEYVIVIEGKKSKKVT